MTVEQDVETATKACEARAERARQAAELHKENRTV